MFLFPNDTFKLFSVESFDPMTLAENYETKSDNVGYNDGKVNILGY